MQRIPNPARGIYIHWPFCPYRCFFCPFVALSGQDEYIPRYHAALNQEIIQYAEQQATKEPISTLFIGGGTPSTWPPNLLLDTFGILKEVITFSTNHEITLEVNPGTITEEKISAWIDAGINRISMGVQSLNEKVLATLNRHHSVNDVHRFLDVLAQQFSSLSVDLILGLPGVGVTEWQEYIRTVITWPINHVSVYFLTVHEDTKLYYGVQQGQFILPADETMVDMYLWTIETLSSAGFVQYEISNFAKQGHQSQHNTLYWERNPYKGFGLGACSFNGTMRTQNEKNLMTYLACIAEKKSPIVSQETLTQQQTALEKIMLGIRQTKGLDIEVLAHLLNQSSLQTLEESIKDLIAADLLVRQHNQIALTPRGKALENEIVIRFTQNIHY